jgi:Phage integrase family.
MTSKIVLVRLFYPAYTLEQMRTRQSKSPGVFQKVGECLYRFSSNGVYYARFESRGKEIRRSLRTTDRASAQRALASLKQDQEQVDPAQGKLTIAELSHRYSATVQHQKPKTIERKSLIIRRIKKHWPTGPLTQITKVKPSHVDVWISRYRFGPHSRNLHMACIKEMFDMAVRDGIIWRSPAAHLRRVKPAKPIRATPSFEEFKAIVESIRSQKYNGHDAKESADFVEFLGLAGLGKAEAAALRQIDIDWRRETITTFRHKTKSGFAVPIYPQLKPLLLRRRRDDAPNERVFKIDNAKKAIANACRRLNLPQYSHISFRRMFITRAIERGVDVKVIAEWQGHKDGGKLILDTHSHVNRAHSHRMAQLMTDGLPVENIIPIAALV